MYTEREIQARMSIVKCFVETEGVPCTDDSLRSFANEVVTDSIRELLGSVIRVVAYASLTGQAITPTLIESVCRAPVRVAGKPYEINDRNDGRNLLH